MEKHRTSETVDPAHFEKRPIRTDEHEPDEGWWIQFTNGSQLTVLDRMTGFGWRDVETGYRNKDAAFWLASGMKDVRDFKGTYREAIRWVKKRAQIRNHKPK